jgi:prophage regulatory protein
VFNWTQADIMTDDRSHPRTTLIRLDRVKARTCLSRSTIYAYMRDGRFPQPVTISERCVAWVETEIEAWIAERIAARRTS